MVRDAADRGFVATLAEPQSTFIPLNVCVFVGFSRQGWERLQCIMTLPDGLALALGER
jgi:hypothetical protein